jgi:aminoglycoside/choline kinase family phosphotransferase
VSPAVGAHYLRLRGLVGAQRGAEPSVVEADLRAGIAALADYGAAGLAASAEEELGCWLADQGRTSEADSSISSANAAYEQIGAAGWRHRSVGSGQP